MDIINKELNRLEKELIELNLFKYQRVSISNLCAIIANLERQNELLRHKDNLVKSRTSKP